MPSFSWRAKMKTVFALITLVFLIGIYAVNSAVKCFMDIY